LSKSQTQGLPFTNPKPDLKNQQGRNSYQQGDVKRWLVPNGHYHERQRQRL
jgi:hypothetical protein